MQHPDIANVRPLIASKNVDGSRVDCVFRCPVTGDTYSSGAQMMRDAAQSNSVASSVKRGMKYELGYAVSRVMRSVFGYNPLANVASRVASDAVRNVQTYEKFTEADEEKAILEAFRKVAHRFTWDAKKGTWVSSSAVEQMLTDFEKRLNRAPFTQSYDAEVMARILIEMSQVDGSMSEEEQQMLADFLPPNLSLNALQQKPALSQAELMETSPGPIRENMLLLAWAMLFADYEVDPAEVSFLENLAKHMDLSSGQAESLRELALEFIVFQMFDQIASGLMSRDQVLAKAEEMGMTRLQAERLEVRHGKARP